MQVHLIGMGCGNVDLLTVEARDALRAAELVIGAARLLRTLPEDCAAQRIAEYRPDTICAIIKAHRELSCCVLYSGDTGFYSGARGLLTRLQEEAIPARVLPGISSVQYFSAKLGQPWQDWRLASAHGVSCDAVIEVMQGNPVFFLTGGSISPRELCQQLTRAGLGKLSVVVGENLSYPDERVVSGAAEEFANRSFAPLSVMLCEAAPSTRRLPSGIADDQFLRGKVPMTKQEIRAVLLGKLAIQPEETVWDIGGGTGSVSVELALAASRGHVYSIESKDEACDLIRKNRDVFGTWNLSVVPGEAPDALEELPAPDAVFVGGSSGKLEDILDRICRKNPMARICISAIAIETLGVAVSALTNRGFCVEVVQIAASRSRPAGSLHLLMANNPTFLITGVPHD
ncbi:MAG: precorrin-6y C5,15-methyltransferase (decarboxylating) subunit CbiE [Eubacteriales bacterium]|nr:precorrin-6y C5,15-methyltransferase (decarboxylating) subunit CbiE [Eubacteriales bacterium]